MTALSHPVSSLGYRVWRVRLIAALGALCLASSQALPLAHAQAPAPAIHQSSQPSTLQPVLAQGSLEGPMERFARFVKPILLIVAFVMVVAAGFAIHDGDVRKMIYMLIGAFVVLLAWFIVNELSRIAT